MLFGHRFFQSVEKPLSLSKNGGLALLAMLVLHRAKLLASNQSVLAWGVAPRQVAGTPVPVFTPFPGERGFRQGRRNKDTPSFARSKANRVS